MKILTERQFKEEICKAIEKERIRLDEYERERNLNKRIDELYMKIARLEARLETTCENVMELKHEQG